MLNMAFGALSGHILRERGTHFFFSSHFLFHFIFHFLEQLILFKVLNGIDHMICGDGTPLKEAGVL